MRQVPCPISPEELRRLYVEDQHTDKEVAILLGSGATAKRVRGWRLRYGIDTLTRTARHEVTPIKDRLQSVLIGSMLGDGRLAKNTHSARYVENHSDAQKPYLEWKVQEWGIWVKTAVASTQWRGFIGWRFETVSHSSLVPWHGLFYPQPGPKRLQEQVIDLVDPLALAIWYMDDGSSGWWPRITFGMDPASRDIALAIFDKFGFSPRWELHQGKTGDFIFDGEAQAEKFIALVTPHMPDCMLYKLDFGFQGPHYQVRQKLDETELKRLASEGVPIRRIASLLGVGPTTVSRYLRNFNIYHPRLVGRPS